MNLEFGNFERKILEVSEKHSSHTPSQGAKGKDRTLKCLISFTEYSQIPSFSHP